MCQICNPGPMEFVRRLESVTKTVMTMRRVMEGRGRKPTSGMKQRRRLCDTARSTRMTGFRRLTLSIQKGERNWTREDSDMSNKIVLM